MVGDAAGIAAVAFYGINSLAIRSDDNAYMVCTAVTSQSKKITSPGAKSL